MQHYQWVYLCGFKGSLVSSIMGGGLIMTSKESQGYADSPGKLKQCLSCKEMLYCSKASQKQSRAELQKECTHLSVPMKSFPVKRKMLTLFSPWLQLAKTLSECYLNGQQLLCETKVLRCPSLMKDEVRNIYQPQGWEIFWDTWLIWWIDIISIDCCKCNWNLSWIETPLQLASEILTKTKQLFSNT